jgi:hypothetical protein
MLTNETWVQETDLQPWGKNSRNPLDYVIQMGAHGNVVVKALCHKPEDPAALGPGVYSDSNINKYQKQRNNVSAEQSAAGA